MIKSDTFRLTPAAYLRVTAAGSVLRLLLVLGVPLLALLVAGLVDPRWWLVALIVALLIMPMAIGHVYFTRLLTTEAQRALTPQNVEIDPGSHIDITYHSADEANTTALPPNERTPWAEVALVEIKSGCLMVHITNRKLPLLIPMDSLANDPSRKEACKLAESYFVA